MPLSMNYETQDFARIAIQSWQGDLDSLQHINDSGNSVYRFKGNDRPLILRLTDPSYRTRAWNQAELDYLLHLHTNAVQVGVPVISDTGLWIEEISIGDTVWMASAFTVAQGEVVQIASAYWNETFFREWGRILARLHRASSTFTASDSARRWHWHEEDLVANALTYLPADDAISLREFDYLTSFLHSLPINPATYGMTHADFGAQNFHYDPQIGITAFDFGNCCYHWYVCDIAISLSTLRDQGGMTRKHYQEWLLAGYREIFPLDESLCEQLDLFMQWRVFYVYLDRLERFRTSSSPEYQQILRFLRERVHQQAQR